MPTHTRRSTSLSTTLAAGLLATACAAAGAAEPGSGAQLAQRVYDRPDGTDLAARMRMTLTEAGRQPRVRVLYSFAADRGERQRWSLLRFVEPADVEGTGLLTADYPGDENDQWLYLPALDRVRRIASSRKGGRFVGSDFWYEDLRDREPEMDRHTLGEQTTLGRTPCRTLVSEPVDPANSAYARRVSCVHEATLVPLQVEYYLAGRDRPVKRLSVKRLKRIQGYWTVVDTLMEDLESGHSTRLDIEAIKYDQGLPDTLFTRRALADDRRERAYRP